MKSLVKATIFLSLMLIHLPCFAQKEKKAMIIGIDGCRPDALQIANTPQMDSLLVNSLYSYDALNDDITISGPGWSSILCGVWSNKHEVTNNAFLTSNYEEYPSIFELVENEDPSIETVSIAHWGPINSFIVQDAADFKMTVSSDLDVAQECANYLSANDPDLVFLHFDDVDHAGHANGFSPDVAPYTSAIEGVDSYLEIVFDGIRSRQTYSDEDWLIIITTDHGGTGFSHGGNSSEEEIIFFIVHHPIIESALIEKDSSYVINENANCLAQTEVLSFDGSNDFIEIADNPLLPFDINQDFTVEFQIKTDEAADVAILGNKDWTTGANQGFVFSFEYPFGPAWKINISDGDTRIDLESGGAIADNQWHHLAASFDRDGYVKMYEDGVLLDSANISGLGDINTGLGLFIGADVDSDFDFQGYVSDVRIWNTILEESTISQWQCMPLAQDHPNNANLIAHYPLDASNAAQSNLISDASPNALDGILEGAMWESSDSSLVYSYQSTPRLTDVVPTVLEHLCIQENEAWALDGKSWIEEYFENINPRRVHPSIFLEGAYLGGGLMSTNLTAQIPLTHPYGNAPYNYGGSETLTVVPTTMVDWVLVELRSGIPSLSGARTTTTEETQAAILMSNGEIVDVQGDPLIFQNVQTGTDYHLCIRHRNHLDVLSAYAVTGTNDMYFDFTDNLAQAYGEEQLKIHGDGSALLLAGEFNQDAVIQNTDYNAWKLNPAQTNVYRKTDANLDGTVQTTDFDWWTINKAKIGHPEAGF